MALGRPRLGIGFDGIGEMLNELRAFAFLPGALQAEEGGV